MAAGDSEAYMEDKGKTAVARATGVLMASTILSRLLGYVRDILIATIYGQTRVTDAYLAAFSIPDFLYNLLVAGTVTAAFIPVFSRYISTDRDSEGWEVASTIYNIAIVIMLIGVVAAGVLAPSIVSVLVPGYEPEYKRLTVTMTRIMLGQAFFMGLNGISAGVLQSYQRFTEPAIASVMYNAMIIAFGATLSAGLGIQAFAIGVVAGAVAQFATLAYGLRRVGFKWKPVMLWKHPGVRRVYLLMIPVFLSYALTQIGLFVQQNISSSLPGVVSAMRNAQRLMMLPVSIFAITMVIAIFPTLNTQIARGEMDAFKESCAFGLSSIFFITVPCAVGLAVLGGPIVRALYQQGSFTAQNAAVTANILVFFCVGLFAQGGVHLMNRVFYATQNTWIPVIIGACGIVINILLNYALIIPMGAGGLSLAYSLAGIVTLSLLIYVAGRKIGFTISKKLAASFAKIVGMSAVMGAAAFYVSRFMENHMVSVGAKTGQLLQVGSGVAAGAAVYFALSVALKMDEIEMVKQALRRKRS